MSLIIVYVCACGFVCMCVIQGLCLLWIWSVTLLWSSGEPHYTLAPASQTEILPFSLFLIKRSWRVKLTSTRHSKKAQCDETLCSSALTYIQRECVCAVMNRYVCVGMSQLDQVFAHLKHKTPVAAAATAFFFAVMSKFCQGVEHTHTHGFLPV